MRIFIEVEVRVTPYAPTKRQRNGIIVHREKRDGGEDIYGSKNAEIYREMRRLFGANCKISIAYLIAEEDAIV